MHCLLDCDLVQAGYGLDASLFALDAIIRQCWKGWIEYDSSSSSSDSSEDA